MSTGIMTNPHGSRPWGKHQQRGGKERRADLQTRSRSKSRGSSSERTGESATSHGPRVTDAINSIDSAFHATPR